MAQDSLWFGVLDIGEKGSPVVRDRNLRTKSSDSIYLYNFKRNAIIEYKLAIVEPKLRKLNRDEESLIDELELAYEEALHNFVPQTRLGQAESRPSGTTANKKKVEEEDAFEDAVEGDDDYDDF